MFWTSKLSRKDDIGAVECSDRMMPWLAKRNLMETVQTTKKRKQDNGDVVHRSSPRKRLGAYFSRHLPRQRSCKLWCQRLNDSRRSLSGNVTKEPRTPFKKERKKENLPPRGRILCSTSRLSLGRGLTAARLICSVDQSLSSGLKWCWLSPK